MPIGATIGAAVIAGGATVATGAMASHSQSQAAQSAADTSLQVADKNNAFAQSIYDQNAGRLDPYATRGNTAGDAIMSMLLGEAPASGGSGTSTGGGATGSTGSTGGGTGGTQPHPSSPVNVSTGTAAFGTTGLSPGQRAAMMGGEPMGRPTIGPQANGDHISTGGAGVLNVFADHAGYGQTSATPPPVSSGGAGAGTGAGAGSGSGTGSALSPWDQFRNSTNYQFRLNQGLDATASKYAAGGAFESGAEKQAINDYAQNFASNELANFMDRLYQQEALGASAASSLAGVGTNLVSQVNANNTNAGNAAANAALVSGQASANNFNNIGSAIGSVAGTIGGALSSSYHPATTAPAYSIPTGDGFSGGWLYPGMGG